ncbi:site-specific integrase, partial [Vibrio sp. 10N.222.55.C6]
QQSITEHLDLSTFIKPTQSLKIDALSLSAEEVHHLVTQLLTHSLSPMQALFASVSALLSYYGALRRGELLRLRLQDIRCTHEKGQLFAIYITNTEEGKTKSGDARTVQVVMPEIGAKLIRLLLAFKANRPPSEPFIGFE